MRRRLAVTMPSRRPFAAQAREQVEHAVERLERLVQRLVVRAVGLDELVHAVGIEVAHLRDQPGAADRRAHELLVRLTPEHGHETRASSRPG